MIDAIDAIDFVYEYDKDGLWVFRVLSTGHRYVLEFSHSQGQYVTPEALREAARAIEEHQTQMKYRNAIREIETLLRDGIANPNPRLLLVTIRDRAFKALEG